MSFEPPSLGDLHSGNPHQFLPAQAILGQEIPKRLRCVADSVIAAELDESFLERLRLDDRGEVAGEFLDAGLGRTGGREGTKPSLCVIWWQSGRAERGHAQKRRCLLSFRHGNRLGETGLNPFEHRGRGNRKEQMRVATVRRW